MQLRAISTGPGVPGSDFRGAVHSTFRHACTLSTTGGLLLTLLPAGTGNLPQGIRLNTPDNFVFSEHIRVGQPVGCRAGVLRFRGAAFQVDLRGALRWAIDISSLGVDLEQPPSRRAWQAAWLELLNSRPLDGFGLLLETGSLPPESLRLSQNTLGKIRGLLRAVRRRHVEAAACAATALIGLGPGLTPSGDDFLTGFVAGLWSTAGGDASRLAFLASFGARIAGASKTTTQTSRIYLEHAAAGRFSEALTTLAEQIGRGREPGQVKQAAQAALRVGSTSGADGVLGLLLGLAAWKMIRILYHPPGLCLHC